MTQTQTSVEKVWFDPCDRIGVRGIQYRCVKTDEVGHVFQRVDDPRISEGFTHAAFALVQKRPDYRYDRRWFSFAKANALLRSDAERLQDIPARELPKVLWKWEFCQEFLRLEKLGLTTRSGPAMEAAALVIAGKVSSLDCARTPAKGKPCKKLPPKPGEKPRKPRAGMGDGIRNPPSGRQLLRWILAFEEGEHDPTVLRDGYRNSGNFGLKLAVEAYDLLVKRAVEFAGEHAPGKAQLYDHLRADIDALNAARAIEGLGLVACPSRSRFDEEVEGLDPFLVDVGRRTLESARRKAVIVGEGYVVTKAGQRIEIDEWEVPLMKLLVKAGIWDRLSKKMRKLIERERWWLSIAIDCATRVVLGMRLTRTPHSLGALATLHMCFVDKKPFADAVGALTPWDMRTGAWEIATDTGASYYSDDFRFAVAATGATFNNPPAGLPWLRPFVERMFGSVHTRFVSRFTGRTFENVVAKGDYPAQARASLTVDDFAWAVVRYVVDEYHNRPHEGLGGRTPRNAWTETVGLYGKIPVPDSHARRSAFGIRLTRKVTSEGVRILGLHYQSEEIQKARRDGVRDLDIRLDPLDIGRVSVRIDGEWLEAVCRRRGLAGVSLDTWIGASADLRRRHADAARVSEPIVLDAIRAIERMNKAAVARAGIGATIPTAETIAHAEANLTIGFALPVVDDDDVSGDVTPTPGKDLFAGVIAVGVPDGKPVERAARHIPSQDAPGADDFEIE